MMLCLHYGGVVVHQQVYKLSSQAAENNNQGVRKHQCTGEKACRNRHKILSVNHNAFQKNDEKAMEMKNDKEVDEMQSN